MKVCRICLTKEDMLYPISSNGLQSLYHQLTGTLKLAVDAEETLPQWVCEECGLRLMSYDKLRQKSLKSHQALCRLLESVTFIAEEDLNALDRTKNDLQSNAIDSAINYGILLRDSLDTPDQSEFDTGTIIEEDLNEVEETTNDLQSDSSNSVNENRIKHEDSLNISELGDLFTENIIEDDLNETDSANNSTNSLINNNEKEHEYSLNILDVSLIENINEIDSTKKDLNSNPGNTINNSSLLEDSPDIQDPSEEPKIKEFVIDLEEPEFIFESRSEISTDCIPETENTDTDNNLGLGKDFVLESLSHTENNSSSDVISHKTKNKDKKSDNMKQVDFMEMLQTKLPDLRVRKTVLTKTIKEKMVMKKKIDKKEVIKKKVDKKQALKKKNDKREIIKKGVINNHKKKDEENGNDQLSFDNLIKVKELSIIEQIAEFEKRKYLSNYTHAPFKCHVCFKGFYTEAILSRHNLMHSEKGGKIECEICKKRFCSNTNYIYHMKSHKYIYSCKECKFTSGIRSTAALHVKKHRGKVYKCPQCEKQFDDKSSYNYHRRIMHVSKFVCEYCGYSFVSAKGVEQHKRKKHSFQNSNKIPTDSPTCEICKIRFVSVEALDTHLKLLHPKKSDIKILRNEVDYGKITTVCEFCGVKIISYKGYSKHYSRHCVASTENQNDALPFTAKPPGTQYICEQCGKVFKKKDHHRRHQVVHTKVKPYECDHCHWRFGMKSALKLHILNKHLPKKQIQPEVYPCGICDKTFKVPLSRTRHMATHTGQQLPGYPCRTCGKSFTCPGSRTRHNITAHLKSGPSFVCQICDKSFTTKHKLKEHILHIHQNVPRPTKKRLVT